MVVLWLCLFRGSQKEVKRGGPLSIISQWFQHGDNSSNAGVMSESGANYWKTRKSCMVYLTFSYSREDITTEKAEIWDFLEGICPSDVEYKRWKTLLPQDAGLGSHLDILYISVHSRPHCSLIHILQCLRVQKRTTGNAHCQKNAVFFALKGPSQKKNCTWCIR